MSADSDASATLSEAYPLLGKETDGDGGQYDIDAATECWPFSRKGFCHSQYPRHLHKGCCPCPVA